MDYFHNKPRFKQAALLKGSERLGIGSTDIDLVCDLGGRAIVYVELKTKGTSLTNSQRTLFTRIVKEASIPVFCVVASHDTEPGEEICPNAFVDEVYWNTGQGLDYFGFDPVADGDLISLNQFLTTLAFYICPRLLNDKAELAAWDNFGPLDEMLSHWTKPRGEVDGFYLGEPNKAYLDWQNELEARESKIGQTKQALAYTDYPSGWPDEAEIREKLIATAKDADGRFWWEKYHTS